MKKISNTQAIFWKVGGLAVVLGLFYFGGTCRRVDSPSVQVAPTDMPAPSAKKPHSLYLGRFRKKPEAEAYAGRVQKLVQEWPVVVSRKQDRLGIWHEVHLGAVADKRELEPWRAKLEHWGITVKEVRDYAKYSNSLLGAKNNDWKAPMRSAVKAVKPALGKPLESLLGLFPGADAAVVEALIMADFSAATLTSDPVLFDLTLEAQIPDERLPLGLSLATLRQDTDRFAVAHFLDPLADQRAWVLAGFFKHLTNDSALWAELRQKIVAQGAKDAKPLTLLVNGTELQGERFEKKTGDQSKIYMLLREPKDQGRFYAACIDAAKDPTGALQRWTETAGVGDGLWARPEVKEQLQALPRKNAQGEALFLFTLYRLTPHYAQARGGSQWAERMVGQWNATGTYATPDGIASYNYFDLADTDQAKEIYEGMYLNTHAGPMAKLLGMEIKIRGQMGRYIPDMSEGGIINREVNGRIGRYIVALDHASASKPLEREELVKRLEKLQL